MTDNKKVIQVKASLPSVSPLFSNMVIVVPHQNMVMLDFGFLGPSYCKPYDFEDSQISRICIDWVAVDMLIEQLQDALSEHKKVTAKKSIVKNKKALKK